MQIHERIHIVGSGIAGFGISNEMDCTVYLIDGGNECALIDAGVGLEPEKILKNIEKAGIEKNKISYIFLTHGHGDHSGGAYVLSEKCDAKVYALSQTAKYVSDGDLQAISMEEAIKAGMYGKDYVYHKCQVQTLEEEAEIKIGDIVMKVHHMDGHCSGHACYEMVYKGKTILFSGDSVFNYGKISMQSIWDCDLQEYVKTVKRLEKIHPDILLPSHGAFLMSHGYYYIDQAMDSIQRLSVPENLI